MNNQTTTAAAYRKRAAETDHVEHVTLPSGVVFALRRPNIEAFVLSNVLPVSLAAKIDQSTQKGADPANVFSQLNPEETSKMIGFERELLRTVCVSPRVVEVATSDDELAFTDLLHDDMLFLFSWAVSGGGRAEADKFRHGSGPALVDRSGRKKLRNAAK